MSFLKRFSATVRSFQIQIYLNHWLSEAAPDLVEGLHYSLMTYGGRLLSHLTAEALPRVLTGLLPVAPESGHAGREALDYRDTAGRRWKNSSTR